VIYSLNVFKKMKNFAQIMCFLYLFDTSTRSRGEIFFVVRGVVESRGVSEWVSEWVREKESFIHDNSLEKHFSFIVKFFFSFFILLFIPFFPSWISFVRFLNTTKEKRKKKNLWVVIRRIEKECLCKEW
jgi:hypothetical protein